MLNLPTTAFRFGMFLFYFFPEQGSLLALSDVCWRESLKQKMTSTVYYRIRWFAMITVATIFHCNPWQRKTHFLHPMQRLHLLVVPSTARDTGSAASSPGVGVYATSPDPMRCLFSRLRNGPSNTGLVSKHTLDSISYIDSQIVL